MSASGYTTAVLYQEMYEDDYDIRKVSFFSRMRSALFNQITRDKDGCWQWRMLTGKASRYPDGCRIKMDERVESILWGTVSYCQSEEGKEELMELGLETPEHPDDVAQWISESPTNRELSNEVFRFVLKKYRKLYM